MGTLRLSYVLVIAQVGSEVKEIVGEIGMPEKRGAWTTHLPRCPPFERREGWGGSAASAC